MNGCPWARLESSSAAAPLMDEHYPGRLTCQRQAYSSQWAQRALGKPRKRYSLYLAAFFKRASRDDVILPGQNSPEKWILRAFSKIGDRQ
jgi:hypothetical protein